MSVGLLLKIALQEDQKTPVNAGSCKRVRFRQSECRTCVDICPVNAISLEPDLSINNHCTSCGLCQVACPTDVFQEEVHTDELLFKQVKSLLANKRYRSPQQTLFVNCRQAESQGPESFSIPCLGSISENFMLASSSLGLEGISFIKGDCTQCLHKQGEELFKQSIGKFSVLSTAIGLQGFKLELDEKPKDKKSALSRRGFFSSISKNLSTNASASLSPVKNSIQADNSSIESISRKRPSPKREFLRKLLKNFQEQNPSIKQNSQISEWSEIRIDDRNCATCGICVNMCPTGAITRQIAGEKLSHYFDASLCTNCSLCKEACPQKVISYENNFSLSEMVEGRAKAITHINLNTCPICGDKIPANEGEICTTCQKRQMRPMFL